MIDIEFVDKSDKKTQFKKKSYKILIVDDEQSIHDITRIALVGMNFKDFDVELLHAKSVSEAKSILIEYEDIALALIDVVMETPIAGLDLVNIIRNKYKNESIRLVIRTGQADTIPKIDVIDKYDINDFKEKTELTVERLYTTIRNSVKQYIQIRDLQKKYEDTYHQMTHNPLTQLPNRIMLNNDFESFHCGTLILIDIVGFSVINESSGFDVGDHVLHELGSFLYSMYSHKFKVYHLERDLFALTTLNENFDDLIEQIKMIKKDISKLHIITDHFNQTIDTTIGVAYQSDENLIRKAELALKEARENGKNKIQFYSDDLKIIQRIENTNLWSGRIKNAINEKRLLAYYQPIVDAKTQEIVKYETLVRLEYEGKIYAPASFLKAALYSGQLYDIFQIVFAQSCQRASETGHKFSVNITETDFLQDDFMDFIHKTLQEYAVSPTLISLEILESKSISTEVKSIIKEVHKIGIEILIDDFGIECSNFGQLEALPVDVLKIDGSFIKDIDTNKTSQIIVKTILLYSKEKGLKLVAEFVCSKEVYEYVRDLGIDYVQGYYISKPLASIDEKKES